MCGAQLKEGRRRKIRLPFADLSFPLLIVVAVAILWFWKPWQGREQTAQVPATPTATATPLPSPTFVVVPSATPLNSPTPTPSPTLPPNQTYHKVESGQTVSSIAKQYGTTVAAILQANGLKDSSILKVGQQLIVPLLPADTPTPTVTPTPSPTPFYHTVRTADTLSEIAKKYSTTVEALMQANGITDATSLRVGMKILIVKPPDYSATMAYATYEVKGGDTLITISARYEVPVAVIKQTNGLTGDKLTVGQKLRIPIGTATPTPTSTPTAAATATPAPPYPAPVLLSPPDGATLGEGYDEAVLLSWVSVGILGEDEWYVARLLRWGSSSLPFQVWTRSTSWRVELDQVAEGAGRPQRFTWWVSVMRQTGVSDDGTLLGEEISPLSQVRTFTW